MTVLIELKEKLKEFYGSCSGIVLPIVKFLLALAVFRGINSNLGYLKMLNSMYVVLILSLICAILPLNGMVFLAMLVIIGHCFALHMVIAGLAALVLLVLCRSGCLWSCRHAALCIFSSLRCRCLLYVRHDSRKNGAAASCGGSTGDHGSRTGIFQRPLPQ